MMPLPLHTTNDWDYTSPQTYVGVLVKAWASPLLYERCDECWRPMSPMNMWVSYNELGLIVDDVRFDMPVTDVDFIQASSKIRMFDSRWVRVIFQSGDVGWVRLSTLARIDE